jgi:hypothetical protein
MRSSLPAQREWENAESFSNHIALCEGQSLGIPLLFWWPTELIFPLGVTGQGYSVTPWLPLSMTPLFTGIRVPGGDFSQPEPKKNAFSSDSGSDLREEGIFGQSVFSIGGNKIKRSPIYLFFTSSPSLGVPGPPHQDKWQWLLSAQNIWQKPCREN